MARHAATGLTGTTFSPTEITEAAWLSLESDWHHGYPQPRSDDFGYLEVTYDESEHCHTCGSGLRQKAPFQMRGEPKWGKRNILQLNWVFDEYFVTPELWKAAFQPAGVKCRAVHDRKKNELTSVVQLVAEEEVSIVSEGLQPDVCPACQRTRYTHIRGVFPALKKQPQGAYVRTKEWFGSGKASDRVVLVSQALRRAMLQQRMCGASFRPLAGET